MFRFTIRQWKLVFWYAVAVFFIGGYLAFLCNVVRGFLTMPEWHQRVTTVGVIGVTASLAGVSCAVIVAIAGVILGRPVI
jgi:hypothetical protein